MGAGAAGLIVLIPFLVVVVLKACWTIWVCIRDPDRRTLWSAFWIALPGLLVAGGFIASWVETYDDSQALRAFERAAEFSAFSEHFATYAEEQSTRIGPDRPVWVAGERKNCRTGHGRLTFPTQRSADVGLPTRFEVAAVDANAYDVDEDWTVERYVDRATEFTAEVVDAEPSGFAFRAFRLRDAGTVVFEDGQLEASLKCALRVRDQRLFGIEYSVVDEFPETLQIESPRHRIDERGGVSEYFNDPVPFVSARAIRYTHPTSPAPYCEVSVAAVDFENANGIPFEVSTGRLSRIAAALEADGWEVLRFVSRSTLPAAVSAAQDGEFVIATSDHIVLYPRGCGGHLEEGGDFLLALVDQFE